ncbi:HNH endonuclease [Ensifer adhaerens]|uniref:HNH endonuclease n=1 Tax=Ensifer adhaerens TaxID=106592 RepID=UPI00069DE112|nr:HNH endonuclease [Ensifer adhaerens]
MRRLKKTEKPDVLERNAEAWTTSLLGTLAAGNKPTQTMKERYRHADIKAAVVAETHGKCAYCESVVRHITHGDIEHVAPKSKVPSKAYEWENLTLACDICNENKGDEYTADPAHSQDSLIDPYRDDPKEHFLYFREVVAPRPDSLRAFATEQVLKLSRPELLERRRERMAFLDGLVRAYCLADAAYKPLLLNDLVDNHLRDQDEYVTSSREYIDQFKTKGVIASD